MISEFLVNEFKTIPNVFISRVEKIPSILRFPLWLIMVSVEASLATLIASWWILIGGILLLLVLGFIAITLETPILGIIFLLVFFSRSNLPPVSVMIATAFNRR